MDLNFGEAFIAIMSGEKYSRKAWTNKQVIDGDEKIVHTHWLEKMRAGNQDIIVQVQNGVINSYSVNQQDLLANDWVKVS